MRIPASVEKITPPILGAAAGAFRQIGAESSVAIENGARFTQETPVLTKAIAGIWRSIERSADGNPEKFLNGFDSFNTTEEAIEGLGMTIPGLAVAYLLDRAIISPVFDRFQQAGYENRPLRLAVRTLIYVGCGQLSYEALSRQLGPFLHELLGVGDVSPTIDTIIQIIQKLN